MAGFVIVLLVGLTQGLDLSFTNAEVDRSVKLTGRYPHIVTKVVVENKEPKQLSKYYLAMKDENYVRLAHLRAYIEAEPHNLFKIEHEPQESCCGYQVLKVFVLRGIPPNGKQTIVFEEIYANKLEPVPHHVDIFEPQLLQFTDTIHFFSPYTSAMQSTFVVFPNEQVVSYTRTKEGSHKFQQKTLVYGPFRDISPLSNQTFMVHYQYSAPIPYFSKVEREIEVSHWGNIAVSEKYSIINRAASLKGEFDRVDYQSRYKPSAMNALETLEAVLPRSSWGLSFRDEIGNISSSNARKHVNYVNLEVRPRFPLMGGWKSNWQVAYNLPIKYFVKHKGDQFMLNSTFGFPFKEIIAEELVVRVILPEGASDIQHILPFDVDGIEYEQRQSYLDVLGRPVVVFFKKNAVDFHRKPFQILYNMSQVRILGEPLMLSGVVFGFLLLLIIYFRFNLKLDKDKDD